VEDLSLHILDIAENSVRARAKRIEITITRDAAGDFLTVEVKDDGSGMDRETLARVRDPFFTTKGKKTGLGIPFLAQAAEQAGGSLTVDSAPGTGTRLSVTFKWSHVDRPVIGSMADTLLTLIAGHPDLDVLYEERDDNAVFRFDTREIKKDLEEVPINAPEALDAIRAMLKEQIKFEM
jgi:anti-sigma regulatory factor (Ser/Thr protein kinase)